MPKFKDLTGTIFGRLTVVERAPSVKKQTRWVCQCACGNRIVVHAGNLRSGDTRSCGCWNRESAAQRVYRHGETDTRTHRIWRAMLTRCTNANSPAFKHYGARGITVCPQWADYMVFLEDMGHAPEKHSIDRIHNDEGYNPDNCRWATQYEQANNKRNNLPLTFDGVTRNATEWVRDLRLGMQVAVFLRLLRRGWTMQMIQHYSGLNSKERWHFSKQVKEKQNGLT